jgi:cellulose synthase/poly-beta-1,6-N-acetylglucosamine synthase-like glycosyltransferase
MSNTLFTVLYTVSLLCLAVYGFHSLILSILFLFQRNKVTGVLPSPQDWPEVTVQLPLYNEQFVVERLIDAACALDYPLGCLTIQVLDDSTDATTQLARERVKFHREKGLQIELLHRDGRNGFKAGALAEGLKSASGEFVAILDADFVPPLDFLKNLIPYLLTDSKVGMAQARWGHLNDLYSPITRGQALFLDGHFVVEQTARSRAGLLFNFNGSAGIWRRACIDDVGGWQGDTLAEDLDLSYRAQIKGWKLAYVPDAVAPAEIPPQIAAFKAQQYRWARGAIQVLRKLGGELWGARLPFLKKIAGYLHISAYLAHLFMLVFLLVCLPVVLIQGVGLPPLGWLSLAGFGPPFLFALSQWAIYPDWKGRFFYFPLLMFMAVGVGLNNTRAVLAGFFGKSGEFTRTPKFHLDTSKNHWQNNPYRLPVHWTVWGELLLALYAGVTTVLAIERMPSMIPVLLLFVAGFGYVGAVGLWQGWLVRFAKDHQNSDEVGHSIVLDTTKVSDRLGRKR